MLRAHVSKCGHAICGECLPQVLLAQNAAHRPGPPGTNTAGRRVRAVCPLCRAPVGRRSFARCFALEAAAAHLAGISLSTAAEPDHAHFEDAVADAAADAVANAMANAMADAMFGGPGEFLALLGVILLLTLFVGVMGDHIAAAFAPI